MTKLAPALAVTDNDADVTTEESAPEAWLPEVGSLFLAPNGDTYRLGDYSVDWQAEPFTGVKNVPNYKVSLATGGFTNGSALPKDAVLIWTPTLGATY